MNCAFFFLLGWRRKWRRQWRRTGRRAEQLMKTFWHCFPDFHVKGRGEHPLSSSPVVLWQDKTRHNLVASRYRHFGHYLAKPIPFDLCSWCALFTTGRASTSAAAPVKETQELMRLSEWQTEGWRQRERCPGRATDCKQSVRRDTVIKDLMCGEWYTSINYSGHLDKKIKWPLGVSTPWPTPLCLPIKRYVEL